MIFYQVHYFSPAYALRGYEWFTSKRSAQQAISKWQRSSEDDDEYDSKHPTYRRTADLAVFTITPTRAGILDALNRFANCDQIDYDGLTERKWTSEQQQ